METKNIVEGYNQDIINSLKNFISNIHFLLNEGVILNKEEKECLVLLNEELGSILAEFNTEEDFQDFRQK